MFCCWQNVLYIHLTSGRWVIFNITLVGPYLTCFVLLFHITDDVFFTLDQDSDMLEPKVPRTTSPKESNYSISQWSNGSSLMGSCFNFRPHFHYLSPLTTSSAQFSGSSGVSVFYSRHVCLGDDRYGASDWMSANLWFHLLLKNNLSALNYGTSIKNERCQRCCQSETV